MKKKTIILNGSDLPTFRSFVDVISRLRKDYALLSRMRGTKDIEEPESFKSVIGFLENFVKREKRNLPKDKEPVDKCMEVMLEMVASHLSEMDDWEMHRTIEETGLRKVFERVKIHIDKDKVDEEKDE